ncbi:MAG: GNAT family N-acetyltransferase [Thermoplasmata archaeon]|nr:GNAT family N-acetyltransferase [Thermoplasmata archaeon]
MEYRTLGPEDYDVIIDVWNRAGLPFRPIGRDSPEEIKRQIKLDPEMFLGAFVKSQMIGMIMGSYDSRKGWLNRLAVIPEHQGKGIARALVQEMEKRLKERGFRIIATMIEDGHEGSMELFKKAGYIVHNDITYLTKRESSDI